MATSGEATDLFSARPRFRLRIAVAIDSIDAANNRTRWDFSLRVDNLDNATASYNLNSVPYTITINGVSYNGTAPAGSLDFRGGQDYINLRLGTTNWITHNADGTKTFTIAGTVPTITPFGNASASGSVTANRIPKIPTGITAPGFVSATAASLTFTIAQPADDGGSAVLDYQMQVLTENVQPGGADIIREWTGVSSPQNTGNVLQPNTTYRVRYRARNAIGYSGWSSQVFMTTIATVPDAPTSVFPDAILHNQANVNWTPPAVDGGSTITGYEVQRATNAAFTTGVDTISDPASPATITGLSAGTTYYVRVRAVNSMGAGAWSATANFVTANVPNAPAIPTVTAVGTTTLTIAWVPPNANGLAITGYDIQYATNASFSDATTVAVGTSPTNAVLSPLTPGTNYFIRIRAKNAAGAGAWSGTRTQTTLPAVPPGMTVTAHPSGQSASVALTPPGGISGVSFYTVERRVAPAGAVTSTDTATSPLNVTGLTPGVTYQWRASAVIGTYRSPWTDWSSLAQPNPSTNPGDYFDGSTTDTDDQDFSWDGATDNSTSKATGVGVAGWVTFVNGNPAGATGAIARVTAGLFGNHAARVTFFSDATAAGAEHGTLRASPGWADVLQDVTYVASIWVNPSRPQRLAPRVAYSNAAGGSLGSQTGPATLCPANTWTRLIMTTVAPMNAEWASIREVDVAGDGWSTWKGGDTLLLDGAMLTVGVEFPYFDGSFPSDTQFSYEWLGDANASQSRRNVIVVPEDDPLRDPDCEPMPLPPRPPTVPDDCIDDVTVWRRYWAEIPASEVSYWLTELPRITIEVGMQPARQVRIRLYPNPENIPVESLDPQGFTSELIVSFIPPNTVFTIDAAIGRVYAEVNGGEPIAADHLLYGTGGTPATWPELSCGIEYVASVDVPLDALPGNIRVGVLMTRRA